MSHRILSLLHTHAVKLVAAVLLICAIFVGLPLLAGRNATEFSVCDYEEPSFSENAVAYAIPMDRDGLSKDEWIVLEGETSEMILSFFSTPMVIDPNPHRLYPYTEPDQSYFQFGIIDGDVNYSFVCNDARLYNPFRSTAMLRVTVFEADACGYGLWKSPVSVDKLRALKDLYDSIIIAQA